MSLASFTRCKTKEEGDEKKKESEWIEGKGRDDKEEKRSTEAKSLWEAGKL